MIGADYYGTAVPEPAGFGRPDYKEPVSLDEVEWCDEAGCPRDECVACREADR